MQRQKKINRRWIGIDITQPAIVVIKQRLHSIDKASYEVIGEPVSLPDAKVLAEQDPYQFQWWSLGLVNARPSEEKKGADKGIDGRLYFHDDKSADTRQVILSVKAGRLSPGFVRDLEGVVTREKADIGVLISMQEPTKSMRAEAASAGFYKSPWGRRTDYPRIQLLTVQELMAGTGGIMMPGQEGINVTFRKGPASEGPSRSEQISLFKR